MCRRENLAPLLILFALTSLGLDVSISQAYVSTIERMIETFIETLAKSPSSKRVIINHTVVNKLFLAFKTCSLLWFGFIYSESGVVMQAAEIGRLVIEHRLREVAVVMLALAGIVTLGRPREMKKSQWLVHTMVMACFIGTFVTPVYRLTDDVRQAPLRHVAYAAATQQVLNSFLQMVIGNRIQSSKLSDFAVVKVDTHLLLWLTNVFVGSVENWGAACDGRDKDAERGFLQQVSLNLLLTSKSISRVLDLEHNSI